MTRPRPYHNHDLASRKTTTMAISRVALVIVALSSLLVALAHGSQEFMRINDHLNSLVPLLQEQVRVELRLVGFGDEIILARDLEPFYSALHQDDLIPVGPAWEWTRREEDADDLSSMRAIEAQLLSTLTGEPSHSTKRKANYDPLGTIPLQKRFTLTTVAVERSLVNSIQSVLDRVVDKEGNQQVDYRLIDAIIADHAKKQSRPNVIGIYLLSLMPPTTSYQYGPTTSKYITGCTSSMMIGKDQDYRYLWHDMAAGPVRYGPKTSGEGLVTDVFVPHIHNYHRDERADHYQKDLKLQVLVDLIAYLRRTCRLLLMQPLDHPLNAPITEKVTVHIFVLHDLVEEDRRPGTLKFLNISTIEQQLDDLARPLGIDVSVQRKDISFLAHSFLSIAYFSATRVHTTGPMTLRSNIHRYLDSRELRLWILRNKQRILPPTEPNERIIPVFLFDFSNADIMLLDKYHQAVSYPDMVLAIQSRALSMNYDMSCNGLPVTVDGDDITRPLLGAIVQTGWAVVPSYRVWNGFTSNWDEDYTWSIGRTPFGLLSRSTELSWAIKDAAARSQTYRLIALAKHNLVTALYNFQNTYNTELWAVLPSEDYANFLSRIKQVEVLLNQVATDLSMFSFRSALDAASRASGLVTEILEYVTKAQTHMQSILSCQVDEKAPTSFFVARWLRWFGPVSSILIVVGVVTFYLGPRIYRVFVHKKKKIH